MLYYHGTRYAAPKCMFGDSAASLLFLLYKNEFVIAVVALLACHLGDTHKHSVEVYNPHFNFLNFSNFATILPL